MKAQVFRTCIDDVSLVVHAESAVEAKQKALEVLETYPQSHDVPGVPHVYVDNRKFIDIEPKGRIKIDDVTTIENN